MEWYDFLGLLSKGEGNDLMFRRNIESPDDLANSIVKLANNLGGKIIIGIDINNSHLLGTNLNSDWVRTVAKTHCFPAIHITTDTVTKNSRDIMVVTVPEGKNKPYVADRTFLFSEPFNNSQTTQQTSSQTDTPEKNQQKETFILQSIDEPKKEEKPKSFFEKINQRQKNALEYLTQNENITNRKYRELFSISHKTAHLELTSLVEKGILVSKGLGRSTHYILASKDNVPPMLRDQSPPSLNLPLLKAPAKAGLRGINSEIRGTPSEALAKDGHTSQLNMKDIQTQIEIKPLIKNNEESTEITIEVKDNHPKIKIHKHNHAKEMLENKILKDTIYRSKDFEKCQVYYDNREKIIVEKPALTQVLEKKEIKNEKLDFDKILNYDETKAKEILEEEKELMEKIEEEEIVKRPKIKEKSQLKDSFRNMEKDREKRLNKQQTHDTEAEDIKYEPIDKSETNIIIENPDVEISIKEDEFINKPENKEVIDDGPDQLGLDSFLST